MVAQYVDWLLSAAPFRRLWIVGLCWRKHNSASKTVLVMGPNFRGGQLYSHDSYYLNVFGDQFSLSIQQKLPIAHLFEKWGKRDTHWHRSNLKLLIESFPGIIPPYVVNQSIGAPFHVLSNRKVNHKNFPAAYRTSFGSSPLPLALQERRPLHTVSSAPLHKYIHGGVGAPTLISEPLGGSK